jgi:Fic family protein
LALMAGESVWRRAAAAYIQVLSEPQLFIEGNHRTGALLMSWILARAGKPPFVLSVDNAKAYFDPSSMAKSLRKHSLHMMLSRPKLLKRFAALLKDGAQKTHLLR